MYRIISDALVMRKEDCLYIPRDSGNLDYQAFLKWVDEGGVAELPSEAPPAVPQSVTRYQARAALLEAGILDEVEAYFRELPSSSLDKLAWDESTTVNRNSDSFKGAASALGLNAEQIDRLLIRAEQFT